MSGINKLYPDNEYCPCGGIKLSFNTFNKNFGCHIYGGAVVNFKCIDPDVDPIKYSNTTN